MFGRIFTTLTVVTLLELAVLIPLGNAMGFWPTVLLVLATAWLGSYLIRREGRKAMQDMREAAQQGTVASDSIIDGVIILISGILLMTPGVLSDVAALLLLVPALRRPLRDEIRKRARTAASDGAFRFSMGSGGFGAGGFGVGPGNSGASGNRSGRPGGHSRPERTVGGSATSPAGERSPPTSVGVQEPRVFDDTFVD